MVMPEKEGGRSLVKDWLSLFPFEGACLSPSPRSCGAWLHLLVNTQWQHADRLNVSSLLQVPIEVDPKGQREMLHAGDAIWFVSPSPTDIPHPKMRESL